MPRPYGSTRLPGLPAGAEAGRLGCGGFKVRFCSSCCLEVGTRADGLFGESPAPSTWRGEVAAASATFNMPAAGAVERRLLRTGSPCGGFTMPSRTPNMGLAVGNDSLDRAGTGVALADEGLALGDEIFDSAGASAALADAGLASGNEILDSAGAGAALADMGLA